jgi:hypothetical protein
MNKDVLLSGLRNAPHELKRAMTAITNPLDPLDGKNGWDLHKTVFYLCETNEQVYIPRLRAIVETFSPQFQDFDADAWMEKHYVPLAPEEQNNDNTGAGYFVLGPDRQASTDTHNYLTEYLDELVYKFESQCDETVQWLEELDEKDWERTGSHPVLGIHSLEWWVDRMLINIENKLAYIRGE